jgi:hypothetical protein
MGEHHQTSEIGGPHAVELSGVDPDLLSPVDQAVVGLFAEGYVVTNRRRAVQRWT